MIRLGWLFLGTAMAGLALGGCGDDDTTTGGVDSGPPDDMPPAEVTCPEGAPNPDELMLPCCSRVSNADRTDAPEFRVTNLQITEPSSLGNPSVLNILANAVEEERFNWLMQATVSGTDVTVLTGYGESNADGSYSFVDGVAPTDGGGDPDRWNPITIMGTLSGDTFSAPPVAGSFTVPIFDESGENLDLELPLNSFEVISATFSEDRTCIGTRIDRGQPYRNYMTGGEVRTFITVADARISVVTALSSDLCSLVAQSDCTMEDVGDWSNVPDSLCDDTGACTSGCDYAATGDCNAWEIRGGFAAAGVEIE